MTAGGRRSSTRSSRRGWRARLQVMKPTPTRASPAGVHLARQPRRVAVAAADDAEAAGAADRGREAPIRHDVHRRQQDRVPHAQSLGQACGDRHLSFPSADMLPRRVRPWQTASHAEPTIAIGCLASRRARRAGPRRAGWLPGLPRRPARRGAARRHLGGDAGARVRRRAAEPEGAGARPPPARIHHDLGAVPRPADHRPAHRQRPRRLSAEPRAARPRAATATRSIPA